MQLRYRILSFILLTALAAMIVSQVFNQKPARRAVARSEMIYVPPAPESKNIVDITNSNLIQADGLFRQRWRRCWVTPPSGDVTIIVHFPDTSKERYWLSIRSGEIFTRKKGRMYMSKLDAGDQGEMRMYFDRLVSDHATLTPF